jgi:hypothetical protein
MNKKRENKFPENKKMTKKRLQQLDDDNIPVVKNLESIEEWENRNGRGFWGSDANGYIYDSKNK